MAEPTKQQIESGANAAVRDDNDPRLEFVYKEAVRGLMQQQNLVEGFNTRAGNVIFATAFVTSLLGGRALSDGLGTWDWIAIGLLFGLGILTAFMLWPYYNYTFRFDPEELLDRYVDTDENANMSSIHRELALQIKTDMSNNWRIIQRMRMALQLALILLLLNIAAWLLAISV
jgi:hypothetical protein